MKRLLLALAGAALFCAPVQAADPVKIGMITTLSGGGSALGIDIRDSDHLCFSFAGKKAPHITGSHATHTNATDRDSIAGSTGTE